LGDFFTLVLPELRPRETLLLHDLFYFFGHDHSSSSEFQRQCGHVSIHSTWESTDRSALLIPNVHLRVLHPLVPTIVSFIIIILPLWLKTEPHVRQLCIYTPSGLVKEDVLDEIWVKHWEYKSWITFKLLSLEMWKLHK
jgi:hypothetical protein